MRPSTNVRIIDRRLPEEQDRPFLPGTAKTWLLPFYDLTSRMAGIRALHERAVDRAGISSGQTVVDIGCGTGNLSFVVLARHPDARVTGLDPDGDALRGSRWSTSLRLGTRILATERATAKATLCGTSRTCCGRESTEVPRWPSTGRRIFRRFCVTPASGTPARSSTSTTGPVG
jgi:hypothetical protein